MQASEQLTLDTKYHALCNILRAQHYAWREAVKRRCPETPVTEVLETMWELAGAEAAEAVYRGIDTSKPLPPQVAEAIRTSWEVMGQNPKVEVAEDGQEAYLTQRGCQWFAWHARHDLIEEDRPGCEAWFSGLLTRLNERLDTKLAVETCEALPDGDKCCRRRLYNEGRLVGFLDW